MSREPLPIAPRQRSHYRHRREITGLGLLSELASHTLVAGHWEAGPEASTTYRLQDVVNTASISLAGQTFARLC